MPVNLFPLNIKHSGGEYEFGEKVGDWIHGYLYYSYVQDFRISSGSENQILNEYTDITLCFVVLHEL
jgi:hypothetical protein